MTHMKKFLLIVAAMVAVAACTEKKETYDWAPAGDHILTEWGENLDPTNVLPEYPRPQMVRDSWVNLNGMFDYAVTDDKTEWPAAFDGQIRVPFAIESCLSGVCKKLGADERLWYRKTFTLPVDFTGKRVLLHFGAVDQTADVWVNEKQVASHIGGYLPFEADITSALGEGKAVITVRVTDETDKSYHTRGKQKTKRGGIWYTPQSGIWQSVWIEAVPLSYVRALRITPFFDYA